MSKPSHQEIADALGIANNQVKQLANRGMPINKIKNAKKWFEANGFSHFKRVRSGGSGANRVEKIKDA